MQVRYVTDSRPIPQIQEGEWVQKGQFFSFGNQAYYAQHDFQFQAENLNSGLCEAVFYSYGESFSYGSQTFRMKADTPGWASTKTLGYYLNCFMKIPKRSKKVAVLGAGLGPEANAILLNSDTDVLVTAVDWWWGKDPNADRKYFFRNYRPGLKNTESSFYDFCADRSRVKTLRGSSNLVTNLNEKFDFIVVDVEHTYEDWHDTILQWHQYLNVGGIMCGTDFFPDHELHLQDRVLIRQGISDAIQKLNVELRVEDTEWSYVKG